MLYVILLVAVIAFLYTKYKNIYGHWKKKGVIEIKPLPGIGNYLNQLLRKRALCEVFQDLYAVYPNERYVGTFQFTIPMLMIRDPELIKQITVKDFDHFSEHRTFFPEDIEPLWGNNLFQMSTDRWRSMRPTLSPAFTGSKMRLMFELMRECSDRFVQHFTKNYSGIAEVEMKDVSTRFTNDAIATIAFGVNCDSLANPTNEFYMMGKEATDLSGLKGLKFFAYTLCPFLARLLKITMFSQRVKTFFTDIIMSSIKLRKEKNIIRPDMIHLLMEAQKGRLSHEHNNEIPNTTEFSSVEESQFGGELKQKYVLTDTDIVSQAFIFFFGGFDTVSGLMCYLAYELAINPEIQERLQQELDETSKNCNGKITYEAILAMKYFDMVVSETLRKWNIGVLLDRRCVKKYVIKAVKPHENDVTLHPGDLCFVPSYAIHRDPKYYPNPEKFDPERFNDENKKDINPFAYLPFGCGPRNCIGSRFALLEAKVLFYHILKSFEIVRIGRTPVPFVFSTIHFNLYSKNGFWVGFKKRN